MKLTMLSNLVGDDLVSLGRIGGDETADLADRLAGALGGLLTSRLLEVLAQVAVELDPGQLDAHAEVRVSGDDVGLRLIAADPVDPDPTPITADAGADDNEARITLRLPSALKAEIESAAAADGVSVNTYIVRRLARPATVIHQPGRRRLSGFGQA